MQNLRLLAARVIENVAQGRSLNDYLENTLIQLKDPRDRAFVQAVCYGVCRFYFRLDVILSHLVKKPLKAKDGDVHALLLVGLYQLTEMRVPAHAAVAETVEAVQSLKKPWARGLVNAILREYLRKFEEINSKIAEDIEAQFAHPHWMIKKIKHAWPTHWETVLAANNVHPPFSLRVNQRQVSRENYLEKLASKTINAKSIPETQSGIQLESPLPVDALPGFQEGEVSVQDGAAQLAAELLMLGPGLNVLDACASPGGKLTHIAEMEPDLMSLTAVEEDPDRMASIHDNLKRLKLQANCINADACDIQTWWDGKLFDRILLDAPCSASGVIRRHPDIKLLREAEDIPAFAEEQSRLLTALWPTLKPGGLLLYATCSIFPEENTDVLQGFLENHPDAKEQPLPATVGLECKIGRQILPGMHDMDGFYYACLVKSPL